MWIEHHLHICWQTKPEKRERKKNHKFMNARMHKIYKTIFVQICILCRLRVTFIASYSEVFHVVIVLINADSCTFVRETIYSLYSFYTHKYIFAHIYLYICTVFPHIVSSPWIVSSFSEETIQVFIT